MRLFRAQTNAKRRFKRKIANESEAGLLIRNGLPKQAPAAGVGMRPATTPKTPESDRRQ